MIIMLSRGILRRLPFLILIALSKFRFAVSAEAGENGGFDHRAHSVPGTDQTLYDLDDDGQEIVHLNGIDSHSHFFNAGPPFISGVIESYSWVEVESGNLFCESVECHHPFPVGETKIALTVVDNTNDVATDEVVINIFPKNAAINSPVISLINPIEGTANGGNIVTVDGAFLYRDSKIFFGDVEASELRHVSLNRITCVAPKGSGNVRVSVQSSVGTSNVLDYNYQREDENSMPIRFVSDKWKNMDGSEYVVEEVTCITIGKDHKYYMGSLSGKVTIASVNRELIVESSCSGAHMGDYRYITGIGYNPLDPSDRLFVSTNTHFHVNNGFRWDNAKIESVTSDSEGCPVRGETIISGLPASNHDHGAGPIIFLPDGKMLIAVGGFTNAGASTPNDGIGGVPENPLSASIVVADYLSPDFDGNIIYDQYDDPSTSNIISGSVETYAVGLRNCYGLYRHSNGHLFATDNGPNSHFGAKSISCTENGEDPESEDKLLHIIPGMYYGHPNRNRARFDQRQCTFRKIDEPSTADYNAPIGTIPSSTNGIIEYRANTFGGALKGDLLLSKAALTGEGAVYRAILSETGDKISANPFPFFEDSGVSFIMGLHGELVMPQIKKYRVLALRPVEIVPSSTKVTSVYPYFGPSLGGTELLVTGYFENTASISVRIGDNPCEIIEILDAFTLKCVTPAGSGKLPVTVISGDQISTTYGNDFEYM